ncbi:hypothetical protein R9C00_28120 [Flammeovirgaceae bacterium SG7u.111]|nr:hypothetical protein [Flammeovirgaceae bacterium SG7u.132]WPO35568.1 hypothetical protein R9C00_28120 [Flammeovirgaceae bacterium SG7u.111]
MKKKCFLLFSLLVFISSWSIAQPRGGGNMEERTKKQLAAVKERCNLTEEQIPKVEAIYNASTEKMKVIFEESEGDRELMRSQMREVRQNINKELKAILTESQFAEYQAMQQEQAGGRQQGQEGSQKEKKKGKKKKKKVEEGESGS